jgi:hypothetical protein
MLSDLNALLIHGNTGLFWSIYGLAWAAGGSSFTLLRALDHPLAILLESGDRRLNRNMAVEQRISRRLGHESRQPFIGWLVRKISLTKNFYPLF